MNNKLYGAILGDLVGQPYEFPIMVCFPKEDDINLHNPDSKITDDTLLTLAIAKSIIEDTTVEFELKDMGNKYYDGDWGASFKKWIKDPIGTINNSYGNGCLMRASPFMYLNESVDDIKKRIIKSCLSSHNNEISIVSSLNLCDLYLQPGHQYTHFNPVIDKFDKFKVRADDTFDFINSLYWDYNSTHNAIRKAVSCGGDTDTNASIIGELMNSEYQDLTKEDITYVESKLDPYLLNILTQFNQLFNT